MFKTPFKPTGHYVFNYKPRYYDERKERLEAIEQRYKQENASDDTEFEVTLSKNNLRGEWNRTRSNAKADSKSTYRLALIIAILTGIAMYILK
ncbi:hypothetical protein [Wenyingzhuangia aestuarii]|uniref:hypothetical protein n=1 Tax=Wenyingzhuangia aestuarii TaxID=1647582 RepID=UPI00143B8829|nr:hypothetical protein [Wenyingzhuangia aestuarii]NJB83383.1 hypothetical protein [Wenyingzhuangia aestuarii]